MIAPNEKRPPERRLQAKLPAPQEAQAEGLLYTDDPTAYRRLLDLFRARFFENDALTPEGGFETNIYQVLGFLMTPGLFINTFFAFLELGDLPSGPALDWIIRIHRLVFPAFSFTVVGFTTIFEWDMLFPDRRDFLILSAFPIRLRTLFAAKVAALGGFLLLLIAAVNFFPIIMTPMFPAATPQIHEAGRLRMFAAQIAAMGGASVFGFLAVAAFHGLLINVTSPRTFRRVSPWIQVAGMSLMIAALLLYPVYSMLLPSMAALHPKWLYFLPPVWFAGLYDLLLPTHTDPFFASLGRFGVKALAVAFAVSGLAWAAGFRRHYRRTLEAEDSESRASGFSIFGWLKAGPEENAIFQFTGRILARSARHRLFLATYWSVGISIGLLTTVIVENGKLGVSPDGLRSFPLLVAFFILSGYRAAFQFPAELQSNWLFRLGESNWSEISRRATRKRVLLSGLLPALLLFLPFEMWQWGGVTGLFHVIFQLATGALLVEILFWSFDKVPFTCSYFPGKVSLALLAGIYLYGFTEYSFRMADLETALDGRPWRGVLFLAAAAALLMLSWRRHPRASVVRFDGNEPEIQSLNLT
jgi:hypothetical protein